MANLEEANRCDARRDAIVLATEAIRAGVPSPLLNLAEKIDKFITDGEMPDKTKNATDKEPVTSASEWVPGELKFDPDVVVREVSDMLKKNFPGFFGKEKTND